MILLTGKKENDKGFTFIELLIVTTIIVILASIALPRFRTSFERFRLRTLADRFSQLAQAARELSMLEGRTYKLVVSEDPPSFSLLRKSDETDPPYQRLTGSAGKSQLLPHGYQIKTQEKEIFFYPDGSATQNELDFTNESGDHISLQVTLTGKVVEST